MRHSPSLAAVLKRLKKFYGDPKAAAITNPFELILWENVAYLVDDEKRARAFSELKKTIGTSPKKILDASPRDLLAVTKLGGMLF